MTVVMLFRAPDACPAHVCMRGCIVVPVVSLPPRAWLSWCVVVPLGTKIAASWEGGDV